MKQASRFDGIELSLIRQIHALATPLSINLGLGEPNVEPDEVLREMARAAAGESSWHYSPNAGALSLRRLVAAEDDSYDPADEVCITAGTQEALYAIMQAYAGEGDEVLVPDPGFLTYATLARLSGASAVTYPLDAEGWRIDVQDLARRVTSRTRLLVVNSPSNPTGGVIDDETLARIAELARDEKILAVSDEVYREIYYGSERPGTMRGRDDNVIVVNGMSKSHAMTGLRIGWVTAAAPVLAPIVRAHQYIATCASTFSQSLAERVLSRPDWNRDWLRRVREQFDRQRAAIVTAAEHELASSVRPPAGAFYLFVPVPSCDTVSLAKQLATDAGVLTIPGVAFGAAGEGFLRISYSAPVEQIRDGVERIGEFLRSKFDTKRSG